MKHAPRRPDTSVNYSRDHRDHPLRDLALLLVGIAVVGAIVFAGGVFLVDTFVPRVPARWEIAIFSRIPLDGFGESARKEDQPKVAALVERIHARWEESPYDDFNVGIMDDPRPNALALPGGSILVTTGLLDQAESENELAFILGHELGHFRNRDHLRGLGRGVLAGLLLAAISDGLAADIAGTASALALRSYGREQESDADAFALGLLFAEYGHVDGAYDFFERLAAEERHVFLRIPYASTHPLGSDRIARLSAQAERNNWPDEGRLSPVTWTQEQADD